MLPKSFRVQKDRSKKCLVARVFMKRKSEGEGGENVSERAGERV